MISRRKVLAVLVGICISLGIMLLIGDRYAVMELSFSRESGFYEEPFDLEIYAPPGTEIYYTLDGSDPDENSFKYTGPIRIDDATANKNVYSMRTDVSAGFLTEEIDRYHLYDPQYAVPDYPVDKCTVVRSACRDADGNFGGIETRSYFVGYDNKQGYDGIPVMSVVTDPDNLFGNERGIYVLGNSYQEAKQEGTLHIEESWKDCWLEWQGNYHWHGMEWERDSNIQFFDEGRNLLLDKKCGIRIQGGASRGYVPRSLNIYARDMYDQEGRIYIDLFGTDYMADTVTLFAGGNDTVSKLRDMLMARLTEGRAFATMHFTPCILFLDGEYWGVYWLTEKYDDAYLNYYYDVKKNNVIMIKSTDLAEGKEQDYEDYTEMMEFMTNKDMSDADNYQRACELIDMKSYIDYYAAQIYIGRHSDWPSDNEGLWRVRKVEDSEYGDGRWRWMLFDVNFGALSSDLIDANTIASTQGSSDMFYNLCQNPDFREQFIITFMDLANFVFTKEKADALVETYLKQMTEPMRVHRKRFWGTEDETEFLDAVADVQNFLDQRNPYIIKYLKEEFDLAGLPVPVEVEINDITAGNVALNTIEEVFANNSQWSGKYYTDYPITLTASANAGYRFVGWQIEEAEQERVIEAETITLPLSEGGVSVKAIYEKTG